MTKLFIASRRVVSTNSTTPPPPPQKKKKKGKYNTKSLSCLHGYMSTTRLSQFRLYFITNKHEFQRFELTYISVCNLNFNRLNQKFWLNGERLQLSQAMRADRDNTNILKSECKDQNILILVSLHSKRFTGVLCVFLAV